MPGYDFPSVSSSSSSVNRHQSSPLSIAQTKFQPRNTTTNGHRAAYSKHTETSCDNTSSEPPFHQLPSEMLHKIISYDKKNIFPLSETSKKLRANLKNEIIETRPLYQLQSTLLEINLFKEDNNILSLNIPKAFSLIQNLKIKERFNYLHEIFSILTNKYFAIEKYSDLIACICKDLPKNQDTDVLFWQLAERKYYFPLPNFPKEIENKRKILNQAKDFNDIEELKKWIKNNEFDKATQTRILMYKLNNLISNIALGFNIIDILVGRIINNVFIDDVDKEDKLIKSIKDIITEQGLSIEHKTFILESLAIFLTERLSSTNYELMNARHALYNDLYIFINNSIDDLPKDDNKATVKLAFYDLIFQKRSVNSIPGFYENINDYFKLQILQRFMYLNSTDCSMAGKDGLLQITNQGENLNGFHLLRFIKAMITYYLRPVVTETKQMYIIITLLDLLTKANPQEAIYLLKANPHDAIYLLRETLNRIDAFDYLLITNKNSTFKSIFDDIRPFNYKTPTYCKDFKGAGKREFHRTLSLENRKLALDYVRKFMDAASFSENEKRPINNEITNLDQLYNHEASEKTNNATNIKILPQQVWNNFIYLANRIFESTRTRFLRFYNMLWHRHTAQ